jgi:hypothetical protein
MIQVCDKMKAHLAERREEFAFSTLSAKILHGVYPERSLRQRRMRLWRRRIQNDNQLYFAP